VFKYFPLVCQQVVQERH